MLKKLFGSCLGEKLDFVNSSKMTLFTPINIIRNTWYIIPVDLYKEKFSPKKFYSYD